MITTGESEPDMFQNVDKSTLYGSDLLDGDTGEVRRDSKYVQVIGCEFLGLILRIQIQLDGAEDCPIGSRQRDEHDRTDLELGDIALD